MNENRVLKNRGDGIDYIVDGYLSIAGNALLTIEAGVKIAFTGVDGEIVVEENAGIKITGTSENPVIFTGPVNNQNPGAWRGIRLRSNRSDNVWNYVVIENAGIDNGEGALILDYEAQLSLKNSRISGSLSNGIYLFDNAKFLAFENNVINTCAKPITCYRFGQVAKFDMSSDFSNNVVNLITVNNESIESNLTIHEINIPYLAAGSIWLGNATLTIEAGVNIAFDSGTYIYVNEDGIIKANGNAQKPIRLYGKNQQAGYWKGLEIVSTHDNALSYCTIEHGGMNDYADLKIEYAKLSLENCSFRHSANFGIILSNYTELSHTGNSFTDCKNGNVYNSDEDVVSDNLP